MVLRDALRSACMLRCQLSTAVGSLTCFATMHFPMMVGDAVNTNRFLRHFAITPLCSGAVACWAPHRRMGRMVEWIVLHCVSDSFPPKVRVRTQASKNPRAGYSFGHRSLDSASAVRLSRPSDAAPGFECISTGLLQPAFLRYGFGSTLQKSTHSSSCFVQDFQTKGGTGQSFSRGPSGGLLISNPPPPQTLGPTEPNGAHALFKSPQQSPFLGSIVGASLWGLGQDPVISGSSMQNPLQASTTA